MWSFKKYIREMLIEPSKNPYHWVFVITITTLWVYFTK